MQWEELLSDSTAWTRLKRDRPTITIIKGWGALPLYWFTASPNDYTIISHLGVFLLGFGHATYRVPPSTVWSIPSHITLHTIFVCYPNQIMSPWPHNYSSIRTFTIFSTPTLKSSYHHCVCDNEIAYIAYPSYSGGLSTLL